MLNGNTYTLLRFAILLIAILVPTCLRAQVDTTPPELLDFSIGPATVDVTTSPQTVTATLHVTDDMSGFAFGCVRLHSPNNLHSSGGCFGDNAFVSGTPQDGVYAFSFAIQQFVEPGTWHVGSVDLIDGLGQVRSFPESDLIGRGFPTTVEVISVQDTTPPELVDFGISPASVNVSAGPQNVTVTLHVTDFPSGFAFGCVRLHSPNNLHSSGGCFGDNAFVSGTPQDGVYAFSFAIQQFVEPGTWHVGSVDLIDGLGQVRSFPESDLIGRGFATTLLVISSPADTVPPELVDFGISPASVNVSAGPQNVTVTLHVTDFPSGFAFGCVRLHSPNNLHSSGGCFGDNAFVSGTPQDGVYAFSFAIQQFVEPGTWHVGSVDLIDGLGQVRSFPESNLIGRGFATTVEVLVNQAPVADAGADQCVSCTAPGATQVTLDGAGSSDPDGDTLTYSWTGSFPEGSGTVTGVSPSVTLPLGKHTITLTVDDGNGGTASDTVTVFVGVGIEGLFPPMASLVPEGELVPVPDRAFKQGSTLPLKLRMYCGGTLLTDADVAPPRIVALAKSGDPIDLATVDVDAGGANDNGTLLRFSDGNWIYSLSTKALASGTYVITIELPDSRRFNAGFVLR
jgi:serine protease